MCLSGTSWTESCPRNFFDRVGSGFAQWYAQDNRSNPYVYLWDYRDCALAVLKDHTWNSIEEEEAAYLLLPYTEESYQAISAILDKRLKEFLETEFEDDPELRVARAADGKPPIIPDWDGPLFCYATDRIAQKGYKIKGGQTNNARTVRNGAGKAVGASFPMMI